MAEIARGCLEASSPILMGNLVDKCLEKHIVTTEGNQLSWVVWGRGVPRAWELQS